MKRAKVSTRRFVETLESRTLMAGNVSPMLLVQLSPTIDQPATSPFADVARAANQALSWCRSGIEGLYEVRGDNLESLAAQFQAKNGVLYARTPTTVSTLAEPNDPKYTDGTLWNLSGPYGINAPAGWDNVTSAVSVTVADIDSGVDYRHPDLYKNIWINQGEIPASRLANLTDTDGDGLITFWDLNQTINQGLGKISDANRNGYIDGGDLLVGFSPDGTGGWADGVSNDGDSFVDDIIGWNFATNTNNPLDDNNHGTHTTGTIAGVGNNSVGLAGVAWKAQVMALKFLDNTGNGTDLAAARAIRYAADHGAKVSSNSWGGDEDSSTINDAITYAATKGSLFIAAAGNNGRNTDVTPAYPASAPLANIVSVASTTNTGARSSFSNYGATTVDIAAPGSGIYSTLRNGGYGSMSGTSMATPHVAGAAALVWAQNPTWTYTQIKDRLLSTVTTLASMAGKSVSGGLLNLGEALRVEAPPIIPPSIPNAGFELPRVTTYAYNPSGGSWTFSRDAVGGGSGVTANGSGFTSGNPAAPEGTQAAFLQRTGTITQEVAGWSSGSYRLTFQAARRGNTGSSLDFRVLVDGAPVGTYSPTSTSYQSLATETFTVAAGAHTIQFVGINSRGGDNTVFLDMVRRGGDDPAESSPPSPPPTTTIANAGFELPRVTTYAYNPSGGSWTFSRDAVGGGSGVTANGSGFTSGNPAAPEGTQAAFLQRTGTITQEVAGWSSGSYRLTFQAARRGNTGSSLDFRVLVDGAPVGTYSPTSTSYQSLATETFTVAAGAHTIQFVGINSRGGDNTVFLDMVSVEAMTPPNPPPPSPPPTTTIANAGFELPRVTTYAYNPSGGSWTFSRDAVGGGSGVTANGSGFTSGNPAAPEGTQAAFLQRTGTITQEVAGWSSGSYRLTFQAARRGNTGSSLDFRVLVDGATVGTYSPTSTSYQSLATETFTVTAGAHTIQFVGINSRGGDNTVFLDMVAVEAVTGNLGSFGLSPGTDDASTLPPAVSADSEVGNPMPPLAAKPTRKTIDAVDASLASWTPADADASRRGTLIDGTTHRLARLLADEMDLG